MRRSLRDAMKWSRRGSSSITSKMPSARRRAHRFTNTQQVRGVLTPLMNCWRAMAARGADCNHHDRMTAAAETFAVGRRVEIGQIERELKKLWEEGEEVMTRASLINLGVYSEAPGSLTANTQMVGKITQEHACRAIVIAVDPAAEEGYVEAWIAAHCHVSRAGSKHVCSEQISFALSPSLRKVLPNIVLSHLDAYRPFYLWWQG